MAGGNIKGTRPTRSVVDILISTVRAQAAAVLLVEKLRIDGVDEFTMARARREMLDAARTAQSTADMAETLNKAAISAVRDRLTVLHPRDPDQPGPPSEPPPRAA